MPITSELDGTPGIQTMGFERFVEVLEKQIGGLRTEVNAQIKDLCTEVNSGIQELRGEMKSEIQELRGEVKSEIQELRIELHHSLRDQLLRFVGIIFGVVTLAVAVIKLFPDLY